MTGVFDRPVTTESRVGKLLHPPSANCLRSKCQRIDRLFARRVHTPMSPMPIDFKPFHNSSSRNVSGTVSDTADLFPCSCGSLPGHCPSRVVCRRVMRISKVVFALFIDIVDYRLMQRLFGFPSKPTHSPL